MHKTKAIARAALASMATAALASVSFGGTAFAWGHDDEGKGGSVNCSGSGNGNSTKTTAGGSELLNLIPINVAAAVPIQGNGSPTFNECG